MRIIVLLVTFVTIQGCASLSSVESVERPLNIDVALAGVDNQAAFDQLRSQFDEAVQEQWVAYQSQRCAQILPGNLVTQCVANERLALALFLSLPSHQVSDNQYGVAKEVYEYYRFQRDEPQTGGLTPANGASLVGNSEHSLEASTLSRVASPMVYYVRSLRESLKAARYGLL